MDPDFHTHTHTHTHRATDSDAKLKLADVHYDLGEFSLEAEQFLSAVEEFGTCVQSCVLI